MKKKASMSVLALLFCLTSLGVTSDVQARCCGYRASRGATAAGFLVGAFTGAALAGAYDDYYVDAPAYTIVYPGAPRYAYDYPAYIYSPVYAYWHPAYRYRYPAYYW